MHFLILSRLPEIYSTQRLVQETAARGHRVSVQHPDEVYTLNDADVAIPRLGNYRYLEAMATLRAQAGIALQTRILNPPPSFHSARHKKLSFEILRFLPHPQTWFSALATTSFPVVVKDCLSSKGEGVFLCRDEAELQACLHTLAGRELIFQEFISESAGRDVRAFVIGDRVVASMERQAQNPAGEFRSNLSLGGLARETLLSRAEEDVCLKAVQGLGLDYGGVDFLRSDRGPLLLEVNPCPGLEGIETCTGLNISKELVLYAEGLLSSHS